MQRETEDEASTGQENKIEMKPMEEVAATAPEPSNEEGEEEKEEEQEYAQHEPDTLEKAIELMGQEDQKRKNNRRKRS